MIRTQKCKHFTTCSRKSLRNIHNTVDGPEYIYHEQAVNTLSRYKSSPICFITPVIFRHCYTASFLYPNRNILLQQRSIHTAEYRSQQSKAAAPSRQPKMPGDTANAAETGPRRRRPLPVPSPQDQSRRPLRDELYVCADSRDHE